MGKKPNRGRRLLIVPLLAASLIATGCAPTTQNFGPLTVKPTIKARQFEMADGALLPYREWGNPRDPRFIIIGVHGFNDYSKSFEMPGKWWAKQGILTIAYDQRGFGKAPKPGIMPAQGVLKHDLETVVGLVQAKHPGIPIYLVGESMGSAVVMLAAADGLKVNGIVLGAPAVWGWSTMNPFYSLTLRLLAHIVPHDHVTGAGLGIVACDNRAVMIAMSRDPLVIKETRIDAVYALVSLMDRASRTAPDMPKRTLLLYGDHDQVVPKSAIKSLRRNLPGWVDYRQVKNGYHMLFRDLNAKTVWREVEAWIVDGSRKPLEKSVDAAAP